MTGSVVAGCGGKSSGVEPAIRNFEYPKIVPALCEALDLVRTGNPNQANVVYYDRAHFGLHALAADVDAKDPKLGNQLFRKHAFVEGDLSSFSPQLRVDLAALIYLARQGLAVLHQPAPAPCGGTGEGGGTAEATTTTL